MKGKKNQGFEFLWGTIILLFFFAIPIFGTFEELDFRPRREFDKNQLLRLADGGYITKGENILMTGSTGTGKSYLACALGNQACSKGHKVLYANTTRLFTQLKMAKADGSSTKEMLKLEKLDVLILDDFGMQPLLPHLRQ